MSRRFLFVTWDGGGNVGPELMVAKRLVERGNAVRVLGDPTLEADVRAAGCGFSPWTTAPHRTSRERGGDVVRDYETKNPMEMIKVYMRDFLGGPTPRWIADTMRELERHPADVVVADFALPAPLIVAEKLGLASAVLYPHIWMIPTPGIPPFGPGLMPMRGPLGAARDALLRSILRRAFDRALPDFNAARAALGLAPVTSAHEQMMRCDRIFAMTSPAFDFTSDASPKHLVYTGPMLEDPPWASEWRSPFASNDSRPLVLAGLSSTFQDQVAALRNVVDALAELPVRGLVTLGPAVAASEVPAKGGVVVVASAPHSTLLPECAVLVTHCGHGTLMKGLAAGVPVVCMPMGRDQNDNAARVVHRGAGLRIPQDASPQRIRAAVRACLEQPSLRENARRIGAAIRSREGCADVVESLERLTAGIRAAA